MEQVNEKEAYCLARHYAAFRRQTANDEEADFVGACKSCPQVAECVKDGLSLPEKAANKCGLQISTLMIPTIRLKNYFTHETLKAGEKAEKEGRFVYTGSVVNLAAPIDFRFNDVFVKAFGEKGIRTLAGLEAVKSVEVLERAVRLLADDITDEFDYDTPIGEGNVAEFLKRLLDMAKECPMGIWAIDS